jgi:hypothetical protein
MSTDSDGLPASETETPEEQGEAQPAKREVRSGFRDMIDREVKSDRIRGGAIVGEIVGFVAMSICLSFFVVHYTRDTGFFTDEFGSLEMALLFGSGGFAISLTALRIVIRRKNVIRPLDISNMGMFVIAQSVLLSVFPFDFAHIGDALPRYLSWTVDWISDDLGAIILAIGIVGGILGAIVVGFIYVNVRKQLQAEQALQ